MNEGQVDRGRRRLLSLAAGCLGAGCGLAALQVAGWAVIGTPLLAESDGEGQWLDLGPLAAFPEGRPLKVAAVGNAQDAWNRFSGRVLGNVVVIRQGDAVRALSATCPHNGCDVFVKEQALFCPCHESRFGLSGAVELGPSPRPLDPLEAEVKDGRVRLKFQRFEVGVEERRPL